MWLIGIMFVISIKVIYIENKILPLDIMTLSSDVDEYETTMDQSGDNSNDRSEQDDYSNEVEKRHANDDSKKPCTVFVLSNVHFPNAQSVFRKYRYNSNGMLIPNSVKYFIKLPHGMPTSPLLVPLSDKAFSTLGGFVRFYKEVPPIPQSW